MSYYWFKFVHFAGFISWMAMLFYMPRLYVYHAENLDKPDFVKVVKKMERMLYHAIGWIAMAVTVFSGAMLIILNPGLMNLKKTSVTGAENTSVRSTKALRS